MRASTPMTARTAPEICHRASAPPSVAHSSRRPVNTVTTAFLMAANSAGEKLARNWGATCWSHTLLMCRTLTRASTNSRKGTMAVRI